MAMSRGRKEADVMAEGDRAGGSKLWHTLPQVGLQGRKVIPQTCEGTHAAGA
jgi:hypothetical protein